MNNATNWEWWHIQLQRNDRRRNCLVGSMLHGTPTILLQRMMTEQVVQCWLIMRQIKMPIAPEQESKWIMHDARPWMLPPRSSVNDMTRPSVTSAMKMCAAGDMASLGSQTWVLSRLPPNEKSSVELSYSSPNMLGACPMSNKVTTVTSPVGANWVLCNVGRHAFWSSGHI